MDYTFFFEERKSSIAIIGASRGYGYTLLCQLLNVDKIDLKVACSTKVSETVDALIRAGYEKNKVKVCKSKDEIKSALSDEIIVVDDYRLVFEAEITSIIECTGNVNLALDASLKALENGINVYMVSKEMDSVCGPYLNKLAYDKGLIYTLVNGDQPRNLLDLYSWAKINGFDVIACGKSSEYDFVWDRKENTITYTDGNKKSKKVYDFESLWELKDLSTLDKRKELLKDYIEVISADLCEMNLVSNITKFKPSSKFLSYPVARISELADIFIPREDGGILDGEKYIDVFFQIREKNETSFAGGEFVIVKCNSIETWKLLKNKGHIVSNNMKYACIYLPYHIMGMETPVTILLGDLKGVGTRPDCRQVSVMSGIANKDLAAGETFKVAGHHHQIDGLTPQLTITSINNNLAPFYLLNNVKLKNNIKKGKVITIDDVDLSNLKSYEVYKKGLLLDHI